MKTIKKNQNKFLKHFFISHKNNNFIPHVFKKVTLLVFLIIGVFFLGVSYGTNYFFNQTVLGASIASNVLVDLTNNDRLALSIPPLRVNKKLELAAKLKVKDMIEKNYFAHNSPEGKTPWHFFEMAGYNFLYAGENLAINFVQAQDVEVAWMNSPKHRGNLLSVKFEEIGIASTKGLKDGKETVFIVQMFGTPATMLALSSEKKSSQIKILVQDQNSAIAVNLGVMKNGNKIGEVAGAETYSTFNERFFFNSPFYIQFVFYFFIILITIGLMFLFVTEFHKRHFQHIIYGLLSINMLFIFIFVNSFFL